jgi:hypothetical protein
LLKRIALVALLSVAVGSSVRGEGSLPAECAAVLEALGRQGDFKDNVCRVNLPRRDLAVTIAGRAAPTPFGFGGWLALTPADAGRSVMMGDLVLTEDEVNPVLSALLDNGLEVTALHNHFFWETPRIFYMHVHGMGTPASLAAMVKPALARLGSAAADAPSPATQPSAPASTSAGTPALDAAALARTIGTVGEQNGPVYKITVGRDDLDLRHHGARIGTRMGLNTWAAFTGSMDDAMVAGDVAMLEGEVTRVLKALRSHGIDVVAIHHHMIGTSPTVIFLHYFGRGRADTLAQGVRAALDQLAPAQAHR